MPSTLSQTTHHIRNILDPVISISGPSLPHSEVTSLTSLFTSMLIAPPPSLADLRSSRIHLAILDMIGVATRWPEEILNLAEKVAETWEFELEMGLKEIGWDAHRLDDWKGCESLGRREVLVRWLKEPNVLLSPARARRTGDLGFRPGDWWINALFALKAGIIDSADPKGGIVADAKGAYAVLMSGEDEIRGETAEEFTYRAREGDKGRYRLTAATVDSRQPVRILRSHNLRSFFSPVAGVRYEGLFRVTSWAVVHTKGTKQTNYDITFKRLPNEAAMDVVLSRPWAEEMDDYRLYKRMRRDARRQAAAEAAKRPDLVVSSDGTAEIG
ncbi:hypothetical protein B0A48_16517 [Cryoendolithus antarcticus]|uniref:YDG domain-containing protein n=1 Tax=Cryoendolithus antarcticus TaxID=1507870 RepID=A0A1V8SEX6_9PEZI|nr:hypothetical protein B0A48_16517 [Cryoendolithus antarcticus]